MFLYSINSYASENIDTTNKQAETFIKQGKYQEANKLLTKEFKNENYDYQTLFLLGTTNKYEGNYKKSIFYFKKLLKDNPTGRTRIELAESYLQNRQFKKAKKELTILSKEENHPNAQYRINRYLEQLKQLKENGYPKNWQITASAGYMHDTNANAGTTENTVLLFNLPFVLSDNAKESSDDAYKYNLGFNYGKKLGQSWKIFSNVGVAKTDYQTLNNFDLLSMYASSGVEYKRGKITYSLPLALNRLTVGHTDSYYNYTYGLNPSVSIIMGKKENILFNNQFVIQQREYKSVIGRNGNNITYRPNFQYYFSQGHFLGIGGSIGRDDVQDDINSNNAYGVSLQYGKSLFKKLNIFLSPSFSNTSYKAKENAFNELREDKMYSFYSQISHDLKGIRGFKPRLSLNYSYSKNDSNLPLYTYTRQQVGVDLVVRY